ncbi:MAG TPA: hypothetical protein VNW71_04965 [Thermoanaerobaculia bacterium]|nr:hypothetical protein [Thermoanaerobaculia bacterium]
MKIARRPGLGVCLGVLLLRSFCAVSVSAAEPPAKPAASTTTSSQLCSDITPSCGSTCTNTPFEPTDCWTTTYGPARADVVLVPANATATANHSPNMLSCQGGAYALCFFSGPPGGTAGGQPLPCVLGPDGRVADCTCQYYSSGQYFVDINGILNQGAYFEAVKQCGADGSGCLNIVNNPPGSTAPSGVPQANVCNYINNQPLGNPANSFYPKAQIISTFSFAMTPPYMVSTKPVAPCPQNDYAGCMTAPCRFADGSDPASHKNGDPIQCACPVYNGPYQVGETGQACTIPSSDEKTYVWSASYTMGPTTSTSNQ